MFPTADYYLAAEQAYRHDRIAADFAGTAVRRRRRQLRKAERRQRHHRPFHFRGPVNPANRERLA